METGVLIHGYNLNEQNWDKVVWGIPPNRLGRVPKGILIAYQFNATVIVFGTGASQKNGVLEADYIIQFLRDNVTRLAEFTAFSRVNLEQMWEKLQTRLVAENRPMRTSEEMLYALESFREYDVQQIVVISSPDHLPRCYRHAYSTLIQSAPELASCLLMAPSDTPYSTSSVEDILIVEPRHPAYQKIKTLMNP